MKGKILSYIILVAIGIGFTSVGIASAHGFGFWGLGAINPDEMAIRHQQMFESQAKILGISVDELKNAWAEGKTIRQIIEEKKLDQNKIQERAKQLKIEQMRSHLQTLVSKGVITQAQADKRLQFMQNQQNNFGTIGYLGMKRGFKNFRGFGF